MSILLPQHDLNRFVAVQDAPRFDSYSRALEEIREGRKQSHWIWYVFPQLRGLGHSFNADYYGLADLEEARRYLQHPILGERLREITRALLDHSDRTATAILGLIDARKVRSSMTLFDRLSPDDLFAQVLDTFYEGQRDPLTLQLLERTPR